LLPVHLDIIVQRKTNLMHNLFLLYFFHLYMFRAYLWPIIRRYSCTYVYNNWYLLFFLDECLFSWLDWNQSNQDNRQSSNKNK